MAKKTPQKRDGVYEREDRKGFWISWTDSTGRRRRRKTDATNITQAKQILSAELLRVEQARMLGHNPPGKDTFAEVGEKYLKHQRARLGPRSYAREEGIMENHLNPRYGNLQAAGIRKADILRYVTDRAAEASPYSVLKELNVLKHMFSLAVEWEIVPVNPARDVKAPKLPAGRTRYLQPTELKALLEACPEGLRQIVALAVSTGMRRGEIMGLRHLDVDLANRMIMLPQTKNGDSRIVHLNEMAMMVLRSAWRDGAKLPDKIFPDWNGKRVGDAFEKAREAVELEDFRFHDLRHTAASWLRMAGADIHTVAQLLGHKDLRQAARYQHLSQTYLAEAVSRLDKVFGVENGEERHRSVTGGLALTDGEATND